MLHHKATKTPSKCGLSWCLCGFVVIATSPFKLLGNGFCQVAFFEIRPGNDFANSRDIVDVRQFDHTDRRSQTPDDLVRRRIFDLPAHAFDVEPVTDL